MLLVRPILMGPTVYICCAAATPVSGTRVASGLHPGTPKGVKVFFSDAGTTHG